MRLLVVAAGMASVAAAAASERFYTTPDFVQFVELFLATDPPLSRRPPRADGFGDELWRSREEEQSLRQLQRWSQQRRRPPSGGGTWKAWDALASFDPASFAEFSEQPAVGAKEEGNKEDLENLATLLHALFADLEAVTGGVTEPGLRAILRETSSAGAVKEAVQLPVAADAAANAPGYAPGDGTSVGTSVETSDVSSVASLLFERSQPAAGELPTLGRCVASVL